MKKQISKEMQSVAVQATELTLITTEFTEVIQKSGIEFSEAEKLALGYQPLMAEVIQQAELLKPLDKTNPEHAKIAKRVSLDLGKICSRLTTKKGEDKAILLVKTRLIDGLFNVAESTARLTQKDADGIVDYLENVERERLAALADVRRDELESFGAQTSYLPLDIMGDEQYQRCLEDAKLAFEARRVAAERAEAERIEVIRLAELAETERIEVIRLAELAETERLRLQTERIEAERLEAIRIKAELAEKEVQLVKEREIAKQAADKLAAELQAKKDAEAKIELDKAAQLKAAQMAPDKEKINVLYKSIQAFTIPEFQSNEAKEIGKLVQGSLSAILTLIKSESLKLK